MFRTCAYGLQFLPTPFLNNISLKILSIDLNTYDILRGIKIDFEIRQQNGVPYHFVIAICDFMNENFPE